MVVTGVPNTGATILTAEMGDSCPAEDPLFSALAESKSFLWEFLKIERREPSYIGSVVNVEDPSRVQVQGMSR